MKKLYTFFYLFLIFISSSFATHQRAAEIIYTHINGLTYKIKIITYTNNNPANDSRDFLPIEWGDGQTSDMPRIIKDILGSNTVYNVYEETHTYPAIGSYTLKMEDPNRNFGVANIPNSVNVPIFVESQLIINPLLGGNNSVQLLNEPLDYGCVDKIFYHNPGAYDPDGDSLSFSLLKCRGAGGEVIPGYLFPDKVLPDPENSFTIDKTTGDVVWDAPNLQGEFNIAILIEEWRQGVKVGSVVRDMQIQITSCDDNPPVIETIDDTCIIAGEILNFDIQAYTDDSDIVTITATGGPFEQEVNPAFLDPDPGIGNPVAETVFKWESICRHVRNYPYQVYVKAIDNGEPVSLVSFKTVFITVTAPSVNLLSAEPLGNSIEIKWEPTVCSNARSYKIYRRSGSYGFIPGYCETGVPAYTGYELIHETDDLSPTSFVDDNNGNGLTHGVNYCYIVTAWFSDGAESYASDEVCASLKRDLPVITNVSNDIDNDLNGNLYIAWAKPIDLDQTQYPGPYFYEILRADGMSGDEYELIAINDEGLNDTLYTDTEVNINNSGIPYHYRIDLYSETSGEIGPSTAASSIELSLYETDRKMLLNWDFDVPWLNEQYSIYRKAPGADEYMFLDISTNERYVDEGLENGLEYCYYVKSTGTYATPGIIDPIINYSQKACGVPYDNVPPCPPELSVEPDCDEISNYLEWSNPRADSCDMDIDKYIIYFSRKETGDFTTIDSTLYYEDTTYWHTDLQNIIACYYVRAVDSLGNSSLPSNIACADTLCGGFRLPNAFTPNGDGYNDYFKAYPSSLGAVDRIDLIIFNRYGKVVYTATDKFFQWDGKDKDSNSDLPEAVYYYVCDVYEYGLKARQKRTLKGSITLLK